MCVKKQVYSCACIVDINGLMRLFFCVEKKHMLPLLRPEISAIGLILLVARRLLPGGRRTVVMLDDNKVSVASTPPTWSQKVMKCLHPSLQAI